MTLRANHVSRVVGGRMARAALPRRRGVMSCALCLSLILMLMTRSAHAGPPNCPNAGMVLGEAKISDTAGGFNGVLVNDDRFGFSVVNVGDLDGDGVPDLAVGADEDDDGGLNRGAVWILFMNSNGTVRAEQKISDTAGGFSGVLDDADLFGFGLASLGDLDEDGVPDLAVGVSRDDDGGPDRGAVWVLFMNPNGTVRTEQKISDTAGGFSGVLDNSDQFGHSVAGLGDLDGDGVPDLAVGAQLDDDGGADRGAVWVLFMNSNGTVRAEQKISDTTGGFGGVLDSGDRFGSGVASLGHLDGDGVPDIAVGARLDDDGGPERGAVWILFMNSDGTVKAEQKISDTAGGFNGVLDDVDEFGQSVAGLGDVDGDGVSDLAVGAPFDDDGGTDHGAAWVLFMNFDGTVKAEQKVSDTAGGFNGALDNFDRFGFGTAALGDLSGDCFPDLAVGAFLDDDGGVDRGAVWILTLEGCTSRAVCCPGNADGVGGVNFADVTNVLANFGTTGTRCIQNPGDADCNGTVDFADITEVLANFSTMCP